MSSSFTEYTQKRNVLRILRVDFSSEIGFGHLRRQEAFIQRQIKNGEWADKKIIIICKHCNQDFTNIPILKVENEKEFFEKVRELEPEEVIADNYNFTYEDEKKFKKLFPNIKLICFDDEYKKHYCDQIINHNLGVQNYKYKRQNIKKISPLIRNDITLKKSRIKEGIFISLGGTDNKFLTLKILKLLKKYKIELKIKKVNIYTTSANRHLNQLKRYVNLNSKWCTLHVNKDVAKGLNENLYGIITPSVISYEALYLNLPFIAFMTTNDQKEIYKFYKKERFLTIKNINEKKLKDKIKLLEKNRKIYRKKIKKVKNENRFQ